MTNPLQNFVRDHLAKIGKSPFTLARQHNLEPNFINEIITGRKQTVRAANLAKLAAALEVPLDVLIKASAGVDPEAASDNPIPPPPARDEVRMADVPYPSIMQQNLPVYGTAAGSIVGKFEGFSMELGEAIDYVRRPPALQFVKSAYGFIIEGDSMYPAHPAGELRFANPNKRVQPGDTVIIQTRNGEHEALQCFIKVFVKRTPKGVIARQYNPEATMEFAEETVLAIHHVMTMNELFGI